MLGCVAAVDIGARYSCVVAFQKALQDVGEQVSCRQAQVSHDAEVDGYHGAVGFDEQIAGVDVGVEEAVAEGLLEEDARRAFQ